jgi:hypothetical protein
VSPEPARCRVLGFGPTETIVLTENESEDDEREFYFDHSAVIVAEELASDSQEKFFIRLMSKFVYLGMF